MIGGRRWHIWWSVVQKFHDNATKNVLKIPCFFGIAVMHSMFYFDGVKKKPTYDRG